MRDLIIFYREFVKRYWGWIARLFIVGGALSLIAAPQLRVLLESPQFVETTRPHVCVHTDLIHEPDEWKVQRSLQYVREMGADTIVEFFPWAYIEPEHGQYHWGHADMIVEHAENQGVSIIARMGLVPHWARPENTTLNYMSISGMQAFVDFIELFTARYAGRVDHIIIWNEPNLAFEWGFQPVEPEFYVRMLRAAYQSAKDGNPNVVVMAGAMAPTLEPPGSPNGMDDLVYLQRMYDEGAAPFFDALAVHTYGFTENARAEPADDALNFRRAELLRDIMVANGDADKPVYITEAGWNDNPRWAYGVRPSQRAAFTIDAFHMAEETWPWAEQVCIWILRHPTPRGSHRDNFTLITPDFQPKPIYFALQTYARGWTETETSWLPAPEAAR